MVKPLLVILGPTAVGKTGLAVALAAALNGEIVSADSRQIYRQMDIGTAKPTSEERAAAPHHLIDVADPDADFSLADYLDLALSAIHRLHAAGKLPLLVGGTGQYITALLEGWTIPRVPPNPALRAELEAFAAAHGPDALHARLTALDPPAAASIHPNNVRRVIRTLEICLETGERASVLQQKRPPAFAIQQIGLTMERERLYARADARVEAMLAAGLLAEVRGLLDAGYDRHLPSMSGLGYAELCAHLLDGEPLAESIQRIKHNTHDFIRRQYTWFRGHDGGQVAWHDVESLDVAALTTACRDLSGSA